MKKNGFLDLLRRHLLQICAECEDRFYDPVKPRPPGFWRRRHLHGLGVTWSAPLCTRPGLLILRRNNLTLGKRVCFGHDTRIYNHAPVIIGDDFLGAGNLILNSGSHNLETLEPASAPIRIGNRVWCGERVTILAGVSIGDDVVIGAGSLVVHDIPAGSLAFGTPARVHRQMTRTPGAPLWNPFPPT